ncbi:hypothetical protein Nocox_26120 [Nonomuraea coxensis DSM 45129]|uniref:GAF domain-containing protein n=1 Tax=Nonomuraea coxensis DSM 45129 TaxID=1122611 RepID=A0ABX8U510_9ACTN|nr:hypothetical protein [Nonomuraea coxensis]QYC42825.1 hypothetical protein Nocox_26120 [Nonomuraea coxensis DSM 45129]
MPYNRVDVAMRELISAFSGLEAADLVDRLARAAAAVANTSYAGFVRVDPQREEARPMYVLVPPGDPLRVRSWLAESGVLKELAYAVEPVRLAYDPGVGEPGFLATPVPALSCDHVYVWVAGRGFCDGDEHLLSRYAIAAGRALEAASGLEAAVRLLRGVRAFRPA